ncbi:MAG: DUF6504 family protein [Planctomycetota bacterium]|nr:DUF6504 family protein [Planctomycetota bacterium]
MNKEEFISEPITPEPGSFDTTLMAIGLASLPGAFTWRDQRFEIVECLEHVKQTSNEGGTAVGDRYLRRQSFTVRLDSGQIARIYVERQARSGTSRSSAKKRWFLYSLTSV